MPDQRRPDVDGAFPEWARAAIIEATLGRCAGCGRPDVTCQHRRARGMGGTSAPYIASPVNGLALCGSGTTGCHGWAEHHPVDSTLLGWRLEHGQHPAAPWWSLAWNGWRAWHLDPDGFPSTRYVDELDLDLLDDRRRALDRFHARAPRTGSAAAPAATPGRWPSPPASLAGSTPTRLH